MFTAVVPPEDVREGIEEFLGPRRDGAGPDSGLRWTRAETWHVTLSFMGDVPERSLDDLRERLARAGRRRTSFEIALAGGGAFPNVARARVLYAAVEAGDEAREELRRLATGARAAAAKSGASVDGATFRPHVTLARMRRPQEATRWVRVLSAYRSRTFLVDRFELVQSYLGEGPGNRPRYETVETFPLEETRS
jgi:2'-5' RNA ligase